LLDSSQDTPIQAPVSMPSATVREAFTGWQLWNMNVGFLGIQFGWGLQMANMSAIFEHLGATAHQLPMLWIAAPLTGLLIQPVIGHLSDFTWGPLGRRRPYFLVGAILAAIALVLMPHCSSVLMAAGLLWLLDASANVSMVPYRAFVGDLLPQNQRIQGFAVQSLMVGFGAVVASALPWFLSHGFAISNVATAQQQIPQTVEVSFYLGALVFFGTIIWTVTTTPEYPPQSLAALEQYQEEHGGLRNSLQATWNALCNMPATMRQLAWVQFFTWMGIFCFFMYFPPAVARNIFGATSQASPLYSAGVEWAGLCCALFNAVCVAVSFLLPLFARWTSHQTIHSFCLFCGTVSLLSMLVIRSQYVLLVAMVGFGIAWASALSMPYAMLTGVIPAKQRGIYQGIFNIFVVLPEIAVALGAGWVMQYLFHENRLMAVVLGGIFFLVAAGLTLLVKINPVATAEGAELALSAQPLEEDGSKDKLLVEDPPPVEHKP
jgi:maltose/moltooligosaccharide transporter